MNRAKLLKAARALGFSGASLDELKKWAEAEGHDFVDGNGDPIDITKAWNTKSTATVEADDPSDPGDEDKAARAAKAKADAAKTPNKVDWANAAMDGGGKLYYGARLNSARKAYTAQANVGKAAYADADEAEFATAAMRLQILGHAEYPQRAADKEIVGKAMATTSAPSGSALVPIDYIPEPIRLREKYGVYANLATIETMSRDVMEFPNDTADVTVYYGTEGGTLTASDPTYAPVTLTARKMYAFCRVSSELFSDAAVSVADRLAMSARYALDKKIDADYLIGDGTSTYGNAVGVTNAIKNLSGTIANIAGLKVGTGNAYSELVIADFDGTDALLPTEWEQSAVWVMSKKFWSTVAYPLWRTAYGAGGPAMEVGPMGTRRMFFDRFVVISQVMPKAEANSQVCCLLGDFKAGSKVGIVANSMRFESSNQRYFDTDQIAFRAVERVAINSAFGVGNATSTEADKQPGPIVGLITAAS